MSNVIVFATPVFLALIAIEFYWGRAVARRGVGTNTYRLNDTLNSISLGMMGQLGGILSNLVQTAGLACGRWVAPCKGV